jgi:hypothetical protein
VKKKSQSAEWPAHLVVLCFGSLLAATGSGLIHHGYLWVMGYNARTGTIGVTPALELELFGLILLLIGVMPWKPVRRFLDRFPRETNKHSK